MRDILLEKVRHDEDNRVLVQHPRHVVDGADYVGPFANGFESEKVADDPQHVTPALPRRNDVLDAIGKEQHADTIVVPHGGHRQHRRQLARQLALEPAHRAESLGAR